MVIHFKFKKAYRVFGAFDFALALTLYWLIEAVGFSEFISQNQMTSYGIICLIGLSAIGGYLHFFDKQFKKILFLVSVPLRFVLTYFTLSPILYYLNMVFYNEMLNSVILTIAALFELVRIYLAVYKLRNKEAENYSLSLKGK